MRSEKLRKPAFFLLVAYTLIYYCMIILWPRNSAMLSNVMSPLATGFSVFLIFFTFQLQKPTYKKIWFFFCLSIIASFAGDAYWFFAESILKNTVPFPSYCDVFYLTSIWLSVIGVTLFIFSQNIRDRIPTGPFALFSAGIMVILVLVLNSHSFWGSKLVSVLYPLSDGFFLLSVLIIFLRGKAGSDPEGIAGRFIAVALCIWFVADQIYSLEAAMGLYFTGDWIDPLWAIGMVTLSMGTLWTVEEPKPLNIH